MGHTLTAANDQITEISWYMRGSGILGNYGTYLQEILTHTHALTSIYVCIYAYMYFNYKKGLGDKIYF